jgi:protein translocase SecG subunit
MSLFIFLTVVQALVAAALVLVILIQRSEGGGLGVGGSPGGLMSARGAANFLTRMTAILATMFVILSIALAAVAVSAASGRYLAQAQRARGWSGWRTGGAAQPRSAGRCRWRTCATADNACTGHRPGSRQGPAQGRCPISGTSRGACVPASSPSGFITVDLRRVGLPRALATV